MSVKEIIVCECCGKRETVKLTDPRDSIYIPEIMEELGWTTLDEKHYTCPKCQ